MFSSDISDGLTLCVISEFSAPNSGSSMSIGSPRWAQTRHMAQRSCPTPRRVDTALESNLFPVRSSAMSNWALKTRTSRPIDG
jgi:hypothetical protein